MANLEVKIGTENKIEYKSENKSKEYTLNFNITDNILNIKEVVTLNSKEDNSIKIILTLKDSLYDSVLLSNTANDINLSDIKSKSLEIVNISGNINVENTEIEDITISSGSGNINLTGDNKKINTSNISGNTIIETKDKDYSVNAEVLSGSLEVYGKEYDTSAEISNSPDKIIEVEGYAGNIIIK